MADSIEQRRKRTENELMALQRQVDAMDGKIRAYLADRENKPHPRHQELVDKIQLFRIDPAVSNKQLDTLLDNLQWKVYYQNRSWRQLWENADALRREEARKNLNSASPGGAGNTIEDSAKRSIYSVDRLWTLQREKLVQLGEHAPNETKEEFIARIKRRYGQLASEKTDNDEIVMTFDKREKRCTLELKKKK